MPLSPDMTTIVLSSIVRCFERFQYFSCEAIQLLDFEVVVAEVGSCGFIVWQPGGDRDRTEIQMAVAACLPVVRAMRFACAIPETERLVLVLLAAFKEFVETFEALSKRITATV